MDPRRLQHKTFNATHGQTFDGKKYNVGLAKDFYYEDLKYLLVLRETCGVLLISAEDQLELGMHTDKIMRGIQCRFNL